MYRHTSARTKHPIEAICWTIFSLAMFISVLAITLKTLPGLLPEPIPDGWNPLVLIGQLDWSGPRGVAQNGTWVALVVFTVVGVFTGRFRLLVAVAWLVLCAILAGVPT